MSVEQLSAGVGAAASGAGQGLTVACRSAAMATIRAGVDGRLCFVVSGALHDERGGAALGSFRAVYQAKVFSASDLVAYPDPPPGPFDRPYAPGEAEWTPLLNPAKCEWTFDQVGHVVAGAGLTLARILRHPNESVTFHLSGSFFLLMRRRENWVPVGQATSQATAFFQALPALVESVSFPTEVRHVLNLVQMV